MKAVLPGWAFFLHFERALLCVEPQRGYTVHNFCQWVNLRSRSFALQFKSKTSSFFHSIRFFTQYALRSFSCLPVYKYCIVKQTNLHFIKTDLILKCPPGVCLTGTTVKFLYLSFLLNFQCTSLRIVRYIEFFFYLLQLHAPLESAEIIFLKQLMWIVIQ